jgi:alkylated DNA repair dioxygenase AlkB
MEADTGVEAEVEIERLWLDDTAWVDVARGWLPDADAVFEDVLASSTWQQGRLWRYERWVEEPRLTSWGGAPHPALVDAQRRLQHRYGVRFDSYALAQYRDGSDGQAFHRDRDMKWCENTVIALVTLGARRPWFLRPRSNRYAHDLPNKGATHDLRPGPGDLIVMGGTCQVGWEHSVPQLRGQRVGVRISAQWRWTSRTGRQEVTAGYRAPLHFSRRR